MMMRIFFTSSLMKFTSSLSDLSVDWGVAKQKLRQSSAPTIRLCLRRSDPKKKKTKEKKKKRKEEGADLLNQPLQLVGELAEVAGGDEPEAALLQAVAGQFDDLVMGKAEHAVCQREDTLWGAAADDVLNPFLHLSCGLAGASKVDREDTSWWLHGRC